ncbi:nucleotidyltransferase domain-containing protein [Alteribacter natronophilus]|uniref:nucleotidyltransferase domain-containing protein n=1 Tax=Alteribacter natronophilus TaxID=2583810 RepID=UPI00110E3CED|nr:nucleotidyltransferase domain-containing protein [Alteribacter natronophilus]TMW71443.1 nucleotidyltransferase domain-containing protein [Alteribacter natronophilus]
MKPEPYQTAQNLIDSLFPGCDGAVLSGSVVRGEATATSDLDIVVFDSETLQSYRESFIFEQWPVEVFVHNLESYRHFFSSDCERGRPSMPRMVAEGKVIRDTGVLAAIRTEARDLLEKGPEPWSRKTIALKRYFLTDVLEDFEGAERRDEGLFIAGSLMIQLSEFILRTNGAWCGDSKWHARALKQFDSSLAERLTRAFDHYYRTGEKEQAVCFTDDVLAEHGGRLFNGFSIGKV